MSWIDFKDPLDMECAFLGELGLTTICICKRTGLTPSQVQYRLKKAMIRRSDYRNGESAMAERIIERAHPLKRKLEQKLQADFRNPKSKSLPVKK